MVLPTSTAALVLCRSSLEGFRHKKQCVLLLDPSKPNPGDNEADLAQGLREAILPDLWVPGLSVTEPPDPHTVLLSAKLL